MVREARSFLMLRYGAVVKALTRSSDRSEIAAMDGAPALFGAEQGRALTFLRTPHRHTRMAERKTDP